MKFVSVSSAVWEPLSAFEAEKTGGGGAISRAGWLSKPARLFRSF
jgi:hypothetical protein